MSKILVLDDYQNVAEGLADWQDIPGSSVDFLHQTLASDAERRERFQSYDVIVAMRERTPFGASLVAGLPNLKLLVTTGLRNNAIDMAACAARGIVVSGAPGSQASTMATAELAWGLILGLFKRIPQGFAALRDGQWQPSLTGSLEGKTLGVIGLGRLGQRMVRVADAFGMHTQAWSPNLTPDRAAAAGTRSVDKNTLFSTSDVVSLHLVHSDRTHRIVGPDDLAAMKKTAYLVNTSRAALIAPGALVHALQQGAIAGAGVDVFDTEPAAPDDPLLGLDNVIATPHVGYVTDDNFHAFYRNAVAAIRAWQDGQPVHRLN